MPSAVDIITYVGVPLAVIGVMPVLYTSFSALLTQYRIRRIAMQNNFTVMTRVGLLAGIVEVDLPRWSLRTLDRADPGYWKLNDKPSSVKGGSWTIHNWQMITTGKSTYRVQHTDELRQPQAEVVMSDLITFLLDKGATPSAHGLRLLRMMGLQTPPNTPLLVHDSKTILAVASPEESEGRLSLKLQWSNDLTGRSNDSLPPYWLRVSSADIDGKHRYPPFRIYLGEHGVEDARVDSPDSRHSTSQLKDGLLDHLMESSEFRYSEPRSNTVAVWFASATVAICTEDHGSLTRFTIPARIQSFTKRDTIPHGVLVLLGMRTEDETPLYTERTRLKKEAEIERRRAELSDQTKFMFELNKMEPEKRAKAQAEWNMQKLHKMRQDRSQHLADELETKAEALASHRIGNKIVTEAALHWLVKNEHVNSENADMRTIAEWTVSAMVFDPEFASSLVAVLGAWMGWMDLLMTDNHLEILQSNQKLFCFAAVLIQQIAEYDSNTKVHPIAKDLDDCQRVWGKVSLG